MSAERTPTPIYKSSRRYRAETSLRAAPKPNLVSLTCKQVIKIACKPSAKGGAFARWPATANRPGFLFAVFSYCIVCSFCFLKYAEGGVLEISSHLSNYTKMKNVAGVSYVSQRFHKNRKKTIKKDALFHNLKSYFVVRRCLPLCDKKSLLWVRHRCGHFPIRTFWLTNNSMKFSYKQKKISACAFFTTDFRFAETFFAIFLTKIFLPFRWELVAQRKTEVNGKN